MANHPGYSKIAAGLSRVYFFAGGLGGLTVGGLLLYFEEGLSFWVGISFFIGGLWSLAFAIAAKNSAVAKSAYESIEDADTPIEWLANPVKTLESPNLPFEEGRRKNAAPLN